MLMTAAGTVKAGARGDSGRGRGRSAGHRHGQAPGRGDRSLRRAPCVKEQVESLGAKFIDVPYETDEESEAADRRGRLRRAHAGRAGWTARRRRWPSASRRPTSSSRTALIPGRAAPMLITEDDGQVHEARFGDRGHAGRRVAWRRQLPARPRRTKPWSNTASPSIGETNLPAMVAADAVALYARNVLDFLKLDHRQGRRPCTCDLKTTSWPPAW